MKIPAFAVTSVAALLQQGARHFDGAQFYAGRALGTSSIYQRLSVGTPASASPPGGRSRHGRDSDHDLAPNSPGDPLQPLPAG